MLHCWQDRRDDIESRFGFGSDAWIATFADDWRSGTCLLAAGHDGPHAFTDDGEIGVTFAEAPS